MRENTQKKELNASFFKLIRFITTFIFIGNLPPASSRSILIYDDDHYYLGSALAELFRKHSFRVTLVTPAEKVSRMARAGFYYWLFVGGITFILTLSVVLVVFMYFLSTRRFLFGLSLLWNRREFIVD